MRLALPQVPRDTALALLEQQRPAESMSEQRLLQGDAGPLAPCRQPKIAAQFGHGDTPFDACVVERARGGNGGSAQGGERDAPRRRRERRPKPGNEGSAGKRSEEHTSELQSP